MCSIVEASIYRCTDYRGTWKKMKKGLANVHVYCFLKNITT